MSNLSQNPTRVRYLVVTMAMLMSVLLYLDRFCISFAERLIKEDLGLSNDEMGWILSAFFWSYALGQVPSGWLSDRFGARSMLALYILLWSLFTAMTGLAAGFLMLFALRFGFGLAQAGAYPTAGSLLGRWFPFAQRGFASGVVASGGRIGAVIAPVLTGFLIVMFVPVSASSEFKPSEVVDAQAFWDKLDSLKPGDNPVADALRPRLYRNGTSAEQFAEQLNRVLADASFYDAASMQELPLEKEARRLLERPVEERSEEQTLRINRLVLEAAFPVHLKKVYVAGWRPVLVVYGLVGVLVAGLFWLVHRNRPEDHPLCNAAEVASIQGERPPPAGKLPPIPLVRLMTSRSMWLCSLSQVGTNVGWVFLVTWLPRYMQEVHHVPIEQRAQMASLPLLVGWLGMLLGGPLTDRMTRRFGIRWGRALPMGLTRFLAMGAYLFCLLPLAEWFHPSWTPWLFTAAFSLVAFSTDLGVAAVWAFNQDVGGRHVGSVLGWGNMWGNLGAAMSPPLLNYVVREAGSWDLVFGVCALSFLVAGLSALAVDATKPIVPEDQVNQRLC